MSIYEAIRIVFRREGFLAHAVITFFARVVGVASAFALNIVLARQLGAKDVGVFYLVLTVMLTASIFVRFGLDNALIRLISAAWEKKEFNLVYSHYLTASITVVGIGGVTAVLMYLSKDYLGIYIFDQFPVSDVLIVSVFGLVPVSLVWISSGALKGIRLPAQAGLVETAGIPIFTIALLMVLSSVTRVTPFLAFECYVISALLVCAIGVILINRAVPVPFKVDHFKWVRQTSVSFPMMVSALTVFLVIWSPTLFLGAFSDPESVALYNIAFRIAYTISFVLVVVNSISAPRFAAMFGNRDLVGIEGLAINSTLLMAVMVAPLVLLIFTWPEWILSLFGPEFIKASLILRIIALGQVINVLTGSVGYLLMMTGHELIVRNVMLLTALLNLSLNYILVSQYGLMGAAVTIAICLSIMNIILSWYVYRELGIRTIPRWSDLNKLIRMRLKI